MKFTIEDEKLKEKISDSDKEAITSKCEEIIKWLDANQLAKVGEFEDKQKEMEALCNPIVTKLHRAEKEQEKQAEHRDQLYKNSYSGKTDSQ